MSDFFINLSADDNVRTISWSIYYIALSCDLSLVDYMFYIREVFALVFVVSAGAGLIVLVPRL